MQVSRKIGEYSSREKGPLLVFIGGIHGNELSGVQAIKQLFELLEQHQPTINGRIVGLVGNISAIELEKRHIDQDMNRVWLADVDNENVNELRERNDLIKTISEITDPGDEEVYFFDLHATSSKSDPFIMISDTIRNRDLASMVGVPIILGLLEHLHGMLIDVTSLSGIPTLLFQGGREGDEETVHHHKGLMWMALESKCKLDLTIIPDADKQVEKLVAYSSGDSGNVFYEITSMFKIPQDRSFTMNPGFSNFQTIKKNEVLASFEGREIKALQNGQIFMPLYQEIGEEGFYIIKPIASFWIRFSRRLRSFKHHNKLHWLVGVKKVAQKPLTYRVDMQVTFIWALQVFHLFGYTNIRREGPFLFLTQREDEINPPLGYAAIRYFVERDYMRNEIKEIEAPWTIPFSGEKLKKA